MPSGWKVANFATFITGAENIRAANRLELLCTPILSPFSTSIMVSYVVRVTLGTLNNSDDCCKYI